MKKWIAGIVLAANLSVLAGTVGLPTDRIAFPKVGEGNYLVCVWDGTQKGWFQDFVEYDHSGSYIFSAPTWNQWYWVGLWDNAEGQYVYGIWIGHIRTNPEN